jgi:hypothetical protein
LHGINIFAFGWNYFVLKILFLRVISKIIVKMIAVFNVRAICEYEINKPLLVENKSKDNKIFLVRTSQHHDFNL